MPNVHSEESNEKDERYKNDPIVGQIWQIRDFSRKETQTNGCHGKNESQTVDANNGRGLVLVDMFQLILFVVCFGLSHDAG